MLQQRVYGSALFLRYSFCSILELAIEYIENYKEVLYMYPRGIQGLTV